MLTDDTVNPRTLKWFKQALQDVQRLREELGEYNRDRATLSSTKARLLVVEDKLKGLRWEHEVLLQRYELVHAERDELSPVPYTHPTPPTKA